MASSKPVEAEQDRIKNMMAIINASEDKEAKEQTELEKAKKDPKNLCNRIAHDPELELFFAENQKQKIEVQTPDKRVATIEVVPDDGRGTCHGYDVVYKEGDKPAKPYSFNCSYNGCTFGSGISIVQRGSKIYFLTKRQLDIEDDFPAWKGMSAHEKARLRFRNTVTELYEAHPGGTAISVCESYGVYPEKYYSRYAVANSTACKRLNDMKLTSVFPERQRNGSPNSLPIGSQSIRGGTYNADLNRAVDLDIGGGIRVAKGSADSGAGCGCSINTINLLDKENREAIPANDFQKQLANLLSSANCGDHLDILTAEGQYYLERKKNRGAIRELFPLSGDKPFKTVCSYINNATLGWYPVLP
ncbi:hypothetical protein GC177_04285 [bacterium]|nr:hypothetical protein [bacterium]